MRIALYVDGATRVAGRENTSDDRQSIEVQAISGSRTCTRSDSIEVLVMRPEIDVSNLHFDVRPSARRP